MNTDMEYYRAKKMFQELSDELNYSVGVYHGLMERYSTKEEDGKLGNVPPEKIPLFNKEFEMHLNDEFETQWDEVPIESLKDLAFTDEEIEAFKPLLQPALGGKDEKANSEETSGKEV